jgi:hypothetical protein
MLLLFRKLRKALMQPNKISTYLLYAFGEIILVVIGILIALAINTNSQERQARLEERVILKNLRDDFESAIAEFESLNNLRVTMITASKALYSMSPNEVGSAKMDYLDSIMTKTLTAPTFNNQSGSLEVLLTSGKIDLITNDSLKMKLIAWPGDVEDMIEDEVEHARIYYEEYADFLDQYLNWNNIFKDIGWLGSRWTVADMDTWPENATVRADYVGLLSDKAFLNLLRRRAVINHISRQESIILIDQAREIIKKIEEELKQ